MTKRTRAHLRVVSDDDYGAGPRQDEKPKRWQGRDPIFFHRDQIRLGVRLMYFGRIDHGEIWEVVEIATYRTAATGRIMTRKTQEVVKLSDDITVRRLGSNEWRMIRFSSLSYQATWRIAE